MPALVVRVCAAAALVGGVGCGNDKRYAPDANDRGVWRYGSVPADLTVTSRATVAGSSGAAPMATVPTSAAATPAAPTPPVAVPTAPPTPSIPPASSSTESKPSAASGSYRVVEVKDGGSIHVICRLDRPAEVETVVAFKHQQLGCTDHKSERCRYVKKADGDVRLGNCVVFLRSIREGKEWPEALCTEDRTYLIDQKNCVYAPHVGWTRPSTQVVVLNSDRADHNIHGNRGSDTKFNFGSEPGTRKDSISEAYLELADEYFVKCDIHPWMNAYIHVVPHPYYAITPEVDAPGAPAGEAVLENVPPGSYEVVCWHEGMISSVVMVNGVPAGFNYTPDIWDRQPVTVPAGGRAEVTFTVKYQ